MSLFDDPMQLLIVAAILVVLVMWGPKKIPELARALGQAKGEFAAASRTPLVGPDPAPAASSASQLVETAERLGITTEGKTPEQISDAIVSRARGNG